MVVAQHFVGERVPDSSHRMSDDHWGVEQQQLNQHAFLSWLTLLDAQGGHSRVSTNTENSCIYEYE